MKINFIFDNGNVEARATNGWNMPILITNLYHRFNRLNGIQKVQEWCDKHKNEFTPYGNGINYTLPESENSRQELWDILAEFRLRKRTQAFWWAMLKDGSTTIILEPI